MSAPLKVYGWTQNYIRGVNNADKQFNQGWRLIVAAPSKAAVGRIVGARPASLWLMETGNDVECAAALGAPGTVFYAVDSTRRDMVFRPLPSETWAHP